MSDTATPPPPTDDKPQAIPGRVDRHNTPYDPEKHIPTRHPKTGAWMPRRRPKTVTAQDAPHPGTSHAAAPSQPPPRPTQPAPDFSDVAGLLDSLNEPEETETEAPTGEGSEAESMTAETIIGLIESALIMIGDESEGKLSKFEKVMLRRPLQRVLDKYNIGADVLPAEMELAGAVAIIIIRRLTKPKTATSFIRFKMWIGGLWTKRQGRKLSRSMLAAQTPDRSNGDADE